MPYIQMKVPIRKYVTKHGNGSMYLNDGNDRFGQTLTGASEGNVHHLHVLLSISPAQVTTANTAFVSCLVLSCAHCSTPPTIHTCLETVASAILVSTLLFIAPGSHFPYPHFFFHAGVVISIPPCAPNKVHLHQPISPGRNAQSHFRPTKPANTYTLTHTNGVRERAI